jgi:hypothetical protein
MRHPEHDRPLLAEEWTPRNRGEATEAYPRDTAATELARSGGFFDRASWPFLVQRPESHVPVNAPPPKGGGFGLRPKAGSVRHAAGHLEVILRLRRRLVFDVLDPDLISDVAAARDPVAPRQRVLTPVAFRIRSAACVNSSPSRCRTARDTDRLGGIDSSMCTWSRLTARHESSLHARGASRATVLGIVAQRSAQNRMPVLRHPDHMILAIPNRVAAALVRFHPATLSANPRDPMPPKGVGFSDPLSGTLNWNFPAIFGPGNREAGQHLPSAI